MVEYEDNLPQLRTLLQRSGKHQYRTTIPLKLAGVLDINEGDKLIWALDRMSGGRKVIIKISRPGDEYYDDNSLISTKIQYATKTYRTTVPSFIVKILMCKNGSYMHWAFSPIDNQTTLTFVNNGN